MPSPPLKCSGRATCRRVDRRRRTGRARRQGHRPAPADRHDLEQPEPRSARTSARSGRGSRRGGPPSCTGRPSRATAAASWLKVPSARRIEPGPCRSGCTPRSPPSRAPRRTASVPHGVPPPAQLALVPERIPVGRRRSLPFGAEADRGGARAARGQSTRSWRPAPSRRRVSRTWPGRRGRCATGRRPGHGPVLRGRSPRLEAGRAAAGRSHRGRRSAP